METESNGETYLEWHAIPTGPLGEKAACDSVGLTGNGTGRRANIITATAYFCLYVRCHTSIHCRLKMIRVVVEVR